MKEEQNITQAPFRFRDFIISESFIKLKPETNATNIDLDIDPTGIIYEDQNLFEIKLVISLKSDDGLNASVTIIGFFEFKDVVHKEHLKNYFYVNAPAIIFPYLVSARKLNKNHRT